jgi:A nuclease family of the HNH/ENDO VII superfamily with conserved AHH
LVTIKLGIKNYLQVQKTLQEQAAAEAWAGQALKSLSPKTPKASKPKAKTSKATPPPVYQPTTAEIQQKLDKLKAQNDALTAKINAQQQLKDDANAKVKASLDAQKRQIERREQELKAQLQQIENQGQTKKADIQTELINSKLKANRQLGASILSVYLDAVPPERRQQVMNQAAELYRQQMGRPYNLKDPNDPNNEPSILSGYVLQVRDQGGTANAPVVTKPGGLPNLGQKQGDKTLPTLPIQPKKPDGQQGSFLPKPLPNVKPKSEGEPANDDPSQAQPVTSKASDPSEAEPTTAKQDGATGKQKRSKPTASSVKKAVAATQKWGTDYRANYKKANGSIPAGSQIHHIAPRAVFNDSGLAQEWVKRGLTKLDYPENLQALPQTKDAYDKSGIKIQHSGSHERWSRHAREVFGDAQEDLKERYGSLDKVPDDVMKKTKDKVMQQLREDLLDKDLGLEKGWVVPKDSGMDKLSNAQLTDQIG